MRLGSRVGEKKIQNKTRFSGESKLVKKIKARM